MCLLLNRPVRDPSGPNLVESRGGHIKQYTVLRTVFTPLDPIQVPDGKDAARSQREMFGIMIVGGDILDCILSLWSRELLGKYSNVRNCLESGDGFLIGVVLLTLKMKEIFGLLDIRSSSLKRCFRK